MPSTLKSRLQGLLKLGLAILAALAVLPAFASAWTGSAYISNYSGSVSQFNIGPDGLLSLKTADAPTISPRAIGSLVSFDGRRFYVATVDDSAINQFDISGGGLLSPKSPATLGVTDAAGAAFSPDGKSLYVASYNDPNGAVSQFDIGPGGQLSPKTPASVPSGRATVGVALTPDGRSLYAANGESNTISQFDVGPGGTLSLKSPATVAAGSDPEFVSINPSGKSFYVTNYDDGTISQFDIGSDGKLSPKSPATVALGDEPYASTITPDGSSMYVTNYADDSVAQLDIGSDGKLSPKSPATVPAGDQPFGLSITPDGKSLFVANIGSGDVSQFDIGGEGRLSAKSPASVSTGGAAAEVAITPNQGPVAALAATAETVGFGSSLNASGSSDPDGVLTYRFDFGDGQSTTSSQSIVSHVYRKAGKFIASVTAVDDGGCANSQIWTGQTSYCTPSGVATKTIAVDVPEFLYGMHADPGMFRVDRQGKVLPAKNWPRGSQLRFKLSKKAKVAFTIEKRKPGRKVNGRCVKPRKGNTKRRHCALGYTTVDSFSKNGNVGSSKMQFSGRLTRTKNLSSGVYRIKGVASDGRVTSAPRYSYFKVTTR